jgi:hypothetical protein
MQAAIEATATGLLLGLIDIHSTSGDWFNSSLAYAVAALALGLRHGRNAWQAWIPLGSSLYLVHLAAIAYGYRPPYVEENASVARACLRGALPVGVALCLGAFIRFVIRVGRSSAGRELVTPHQSAFRRISVLRSMVAVAVIALHLAFVRFVVRTDPFFGSGTFYSEGYSEARFGSLSVGMTCEEVETIMGPPLRKQPWSQPHEPRKCIMWQYSDRDDYTANYWRRWVLFEDARVSEVISDFWFD